MEETVFEKDVVEFSITPELREAMQSVGIDVGEGAKTMLGAVIDPQGMSVYPLCVREEVMPRSLVAFLLVLSCCVWCSIDRGPLPLSSALLYLSHLS